MTHATEVSGRKCGWRLALRVLAALIGGVIVSVGAAWSVEIARALRSSRGSPATDTKAMWDIPDPDNSNGSLLVVRFRSLGREAWEIDRPGVKWTLHDGEANPPPAPTWVRLPEPGDGCGTSTVAYGLPLLCVALDGDRLSQRTSSGGYSRTTYRNTMSKVLRPGLLVMLPLRPVWGGLIVDSLTFAALLGMPWWLRHRWVRWHRRRRRLCAWCGYDLRATAGACPECGRARA